MTTRDRAKELDEALESRGLDVLVTRQQFAHLLGYHVSTFDKKRNLYPQPAIEDPLRWRRMDIARFLAG